MLQIAAIYAKNGIEIRSNMAVADVLSAQAATKTIAIIEATEQDWYEEYLTSIISTDKSHTHRPVGIEGLTSLKYVVLGNGEVRG